MQKTLNILVIEDNPADFALLKLHLHKKGLSGNLQCVDSESTLQNALNNATWDLIISDYSVPQINFFDSFAQISALLPNVPFILVSGSIGEERAVELLKLGVWDFVLKDNLTRLVPAIERSLKDAAEKTARLSAERELHNSNERFRMIFENSIDAIMLTTIDGNILAANPEACRLFKMSEAEICQTLPYGLVDRNDPKLRALLDQRSQTGKCRGEITMFRGDGTFFPAEISNSVFSDETREQRTSLIIREVTERKNLESQLLQSQKMEAIGLLSGGIAHDFNNILTAILGYSSLLQMDLQGNSEHQEYINNLMALVERASSLTKGLLAFSRKQAMKPQLVNANEIVTNITKLIRRLIGEQIDVETDINELPITVMADSGQIEQVLMNLATNARDAMPEGGKLTISTKMVYLDREDSLSREPEHPGFFLQLSIADTGSGIDNNTLSRIFEPFFTTKESGKGTGLGLSIIFGIIKQHDGWIKVASEPGSGTTFSIYLPVALPDDNSASIKAAEPVVGGQETILIVEDDPGIRKLLKHVLNQFGYTVLEAADGDEAIEIFRQNAEKISVAILDTIMPRRNGKEVLEAITIINPEIKAIFVSGYPSDMISQQRLLPEGAFFLQKPVSPTELLRSIRKLVQG